MSLLRSGQRTIALAGLKGSARAYLLSRLARAGFGPFVCVCSDEEKAEELESDLRFFLGPGIPEAPSVLRLPASEQLPYDALSPDRRTGFAVLSTLFHLSQGTGAHALVLSARGLVRKYLSPAVLDAHCELVSANQDLDRDKLAAKLVSMGYQSVPVVEDAGSFAVRGGIVDVWSPLHGKPVRLEYFGDTVESLRLFEPDTQRTAGALQTLLLCPANEILFDDATKAAGIAAVREAADAVNRPSSKVRELLDAIQEGRLAYGLESLMPGFWGQQLGSLFDYLPKWAPLPPAPSQTAGGGSALLDASLVGALPTSTNAADHSLSAGPPPDRSPSAGPSSDRRPCAGVPPDRRLCAGVTFFVDDPLALEGALSEHDRAMQVEFEASRRREELSLEPSAHQLSLAEVTRLLGESRRLVSHSVFLGGPGQKPVSFGYGPTAPLRQEILAHHGEHGALTPLVSRLSDWRERGVFAAIAAGSSGQADRIKRLLLERNLMVRVHREDLPADPPSAFEPSVYAHVFTGEVSSGFVDAGGGLALLAEEDIFGQRTRKATRRAKSDQPFVQAFRELKEGDLVVHVDYGIGRYTGLTKMEIRGVGTDALVLQYAGRDKVYLPVQRMRLLQKFTGADADSIALDKLGSGSWERRKNAVREHLLKMAAELLKLYAARKAHPGHAFSAPDQYFHQFEADFPFEETPDQERAIGDVLADMQKAEPMDRLICGDVGYGKTEVALRATFKAVLDKKQVAILVPTTLLAAQHQRTFSERFKDYAVSVDSVSRLKSSAENREVLRRCAEGKLDVVVGTHRLLNADVSFKDLGLLVIDEEQRFGVAHKEKIKKYRSQVDVLTMTATPIPRTLHMSMAGMRDMSIIATPPEDRKAIRTFVLKFDPPQIAEAIRRELGRGGQVYFLHNRVESIHQMEKFLNDLVPEARTAVAHGQMEEHHLEPVMTRFINREVDVLVCSSIIESGLDIPTANTIIVNRADMFGLSQLYQIRGRVGRSRERAYAYLLVPAKRPMTKDAAKRLEVLQSFTELGAGFSIASHDLEIRGGGNLLGPDQSGHIAAVGFDLYAQLLDEAVHELRGEPLSEVVDPDVNLPVPAFIPDDYLPDIQMRLVFYKKFSQVQNDDEISDLRGELVDRFGELPDEIDNLSEVMALKADMRKMRLRALESGPGRLVFSLGQDAQLDPNKIMGLIQRSRGGYRLTPEMKFIATVDAAKMKEPQDLLAETRRVLRDLLKCQTVELLKVKGVGPKLKK
ncbi:MAG: transcription-repair coupling factor [Myxococcales bacterium]